MPNDELGELNPEIIAHYSGPDNGISDVSLISHRKLISKSESVTSQQVSIDQNTSPQASDLLKPAANKAPENSFKSTSPREEKEILTKATSDNETTNNKVTFEQNLKNECWDSFYKCNINKWNIHHHKAYGIACSLYENNLVSKTTVGDPIADVFSILSRKNNSIMLLADGVNWGPRSRLAARCGVRAAMNYLNKNIFFPSSNEMSPEVVASRPLKTHDVFGIMMRSFDAAQEFILQKKGTMTTLCCSVVLKLKDCATSSSGAWAVCTLSIGDSTAYVFNREKGVLELTYGARNINDDRDMRNVGGALGHVYGRKPDVSNLNYSLMYIKEGDIVFLMSDGNISNFYESFSDFNLF